MVDQVFNLRSVSLAYTYIYISSSYLIILNIVFSNLSTVKGELIPFVLKKQLSKENKLLTSTDTVELTPVTDQHDKEKIGELCHQLLDHYVYCL